MEHFSGGRFDAEASRWVLALGGPVAVAVVSAGMLVLLTSFELPAPPPPRDRPIVTSLPTAPMDAFSPQVAEPPPRVRERREVTEEIEEYRATRPSVDEPEASERPPAVAPSTEDETNEPDAEATPSGPPDTYMQGTNRSFLAVMQRVRRPMREKVEDYKTAAEAALAEEAVTEGAAPPADGEADDATGIEDDVEGESPDGEDDEAEDDAAEDDEAEEGT